MNNIVNIFTNFYSNYNYKRIQEIYCSLPSELFFPDFYKAAPFDVEVRMKNDVLAMQINSESIVSMELMTVIGYFFGNYSTDRNCVWTKREKSVFSFFDEGISRFLNFGGQIKINIPDDEKRKLVELLANRRYKADEKLLARLYEKFSLLETMDWCEFRQKIETEIQEEEKEKHIEEVTCMDLPLDWENVFSGDSRADGVHTDSISDGLVFSLNNLGRVDIEYISQITGEDYKTVISALKGSIYQNPDTWNECFYKGWETADEYLTGRVVDKWKKAREANKVYCGYFEGNVKALEKVLPQGVSSEDIYVTLGSPWVPADIIDDFIVHLLGDFGYTKCSGDEYRVKHDEITGTWQIPYKSRYNGQIKSRNTYGTSRIEALYIIEKTLNMKAVAVKDEVVCLTNKSGKKKVINKAETLAAIQKQKEIIKEFQSWIWTNPQRKDRLETIFAEKFGSNIVRKFDGSFLEFPNMSKSAQLYDYQKNAVARIMFSPNSLLAHDVGSGKTYIMAAAGMELKRLGISKKNLYVVPNNIVSQWKDIFLSLYPDAKIFCIDPKMFQQAKRESVLQKIRDEEFDAIIMAYSCFEMIPVSEEYYKEDLRRQIDEIYELANEKNKVTAQLDKKRDSLSKALAELEISLKDKYDTIYFDELGINTLFVDEAHNFKNLPIETKIDNALGISNTGSKKCQDMLDKVRVVQKQNDGRGVVMATGTPITNSITDIYVMQKYLQNGELSLLDLQIFDSWIGMFAERVTDFEIDVDTTCYRMATRFSKFHNLPELSVLLSSIADFHQADKSNGIPEFEGYTDAVVAKTDEFSKYLEDLSYRASDVRNHFVKRTEDNMLKITTDGRKAALDLRLVKPKSKFTQQSKVAHCAENVFEIYMKTMQQNSTQLIFCDTSTPKKEFNVYDELKQLLIKMGIPECKIAYIHDAENEKQRKTLFDKVRKGEVRILFGSTMKLGLGVNVQDKLIAIHHLDVPWRPADMVQREGRLLRQGNKNKSVDIYRYITEGSFDAYSWQLLETKQKMITEILSGCMSVRNCSDVDDAVLNYAEVKALAVGNPLIKERVEKANELTRHLALQRQFIETRQLLEKEILEIPSKIMFQEKLIEKCIKDIDYYKANKREYDKKERKELRQIIHKGIRENELSKTERNLSDYQGFDIVLPTNMTKQKPFVYIQKNGRYSIEMGLVETGVLVRIDNFLEELDKHLEKLKDRLYQLNKREIDIKSELEKKEGYADIIVSLKKELKDIDKKLGVNENE